MLTSITWVSQQVLVQKAFHEASTALVRLVRVSSSAACLTLFEHDIACLQCPMQQIW